MHRKGSEQNDRWDVRYLPTIGIEFSESLCLQMEASGE